MKRPALDLDRFAERFWPKVDKTETCWLWVRATSQGYGVLRVEGRKYYAHRVSHLLAHGEWPPSGLVIDHLCRNRACVNPDHLEVVTQAENIRRGEGLAKALEWAAQITHCPRGHAYDAENTSYSTTGSRRCKACMRAKANARRARNPERARALRRAAYWRRKEMQA